MQADNRLANLLAGAAAGAATEGVMFPVDTWKTRLQASNVKGKLTIATAYRGIDSALPGSMLATGAFFAVYEATKIQLQRSGALGGAPEWMGHMTAAASADIVACGVRNPLEVLKQQMQAGLHRDTAAAIRHIWQTDGLQGFYAGYGATVSRDIPFDAIQFAVYEAARSSILAQQDSKSLSSAQTCACGCFAGTFSAGVTTPVDVVKTRMMTSSGTEAQQSVLTVLYRIGVEEGVSALWRGAASRCLYNGAGGIVMFGTFEAARQFFESRV